MRDLTAEDPRNDLFGNRAVILVEFDRSVGSVAERFDELVVHGRHRGGELSPNIVGFPASFGHVALDSAFETHLLGYVDVDGQIKAVGDLVEAQ